jgi:hypothetical protein
MALYPNALVSAHPARTIDAAGFLDGLGALELPPVPHGVPPETTLWAVLETPFGPLLACGRNRRVTSIRFVEERRAPRVAPSGLFLQCAGGLEPCRRFMVEAMGGDVPRYAQPPGPCFQP